MCSAIALRMEPSFTTSSRAPSTRDGRGADGAGAAGLAAGAAAAVSDCCEHIVSGHPAAHAAAAKG